MKRYLWLLALLAGMGSAHAQSGTLRMRIVDRTEQEPVAGAVVELRSQADTTRRPLYTASAVTAKPACNRFRPANGSCASPRSDTNPSSAPSARRAAATSSEHSS